MKSNHYWLAIAIVGLIGLVGGSYFWLSRSLTVKRDVADHMAKMRKAKAKKAAEKADEESKTDEDATETQDT